MTIDTNSEAFRAAIGAALHAAGPTQREFARGEALLSDVVEVSAIAALEAWEAARPTDQPPWQPIETAPIDGTNIILGNEVTVAAGKWAQDRWRALYFVSFGTKDFSAGAGLLQAPTHWMPLPPPPETQR